MKHFCKSRTIVEADIWRGHAVCRERRRRKKSKKRRKLTPNTKDEPPCSQLTKKYSSVEHLSVENKSQDGKTYCKMS